MKLLFDEHLSYKLVYRLEDVFPNSKHVNDIGLNKSDDFVIWNYARNHNFIIVTKDADFIDLADLYGAPPFLIWIRSGNVKAIDIENLIRKHTIRIISIFEKSEAGILQLK
jgi:predicted nuclease of predicted toxin-antitoxin system